MSNSSDKIFLKAASFLAIGWIVYKVIAKYSNRKTKKVSQVFDNPLSQDQPIKNPLQSTMIQSYVEISKINQQDSQDSRLKESQVEQNKKFLSKKSLKSILLNIEQQKHENGSVSSLNSLAKIEQYKCPITNQIMVDPVIAYYNCSCTIVIRYQRNAIQEWLDKQNSCPICLIKVTQKCSIKDDQIAKQNIMKLNRLKNKNICVDKTQSLQINIDKKKKSESQQPIPQQMKHFDRKNSLSNIFISGKQPQSSIIQYSRAIDQQGQNQQFNQESMILDAVSEQSDMMRQVPEKVKVEHSVQNYSEDSQATRK